MSVLVQPGAGHFNWDEKLARYVAMFIEKAAQHRISRDEPPIGQPSDLAELPLESGWLTDHTLVSPARYPTAAYSDYTGDPSLAFWHLDEDLARNNEAFGLSDQGKQLQLVTFVQDEIPLQQAWLPKLKFEPLDDGRTVTVRAGFVETPPLPFRNAGAPDRISHAKGPIQFRLVGGWSGGGEQVGPDAFRVKFDRFMLARRRGQGTLMVMACHPGDAEYGYAEQPASIEFPFENKEGEPQSITFAEIPDQQLGVEEIALQATADSGLTVDFCVIQGPARIEDHHLRITGIPPRARFPVKVTVAASQWGRSTEPRIQSAPHVLRSFHITR
jgi:hypothetical protein